MLNLKKPHGVVTGHPSIRYMQDNRYYRHDGTEYLDFPTTPEVDQAPVPTPEKPPLPKEAVDEINQQKRNKEAVMKAWAAKRAKQQG